MANKQTPAGEKYYDEATHQWLTQPPAEPAAPASAVAAKPAKPAPKDKE